MRFEQRSYSGPSFRPTPVTNYEKSSELLLVATAWGEPDAGKIATDKIKEFLQMSEDPEATIARGHQETQVRIESRMRTAAMMVNELLYKTENSQEYKAAVELAMISIEKNMLHWVQIGAPHILLAGPRGLEPICYTPDWSWQLGQSAPLLGQALGLEKTCHLNCGSYRLLPGQ
jgi:serine/threonine protein phosphatase PrpC